MSSENAATLEYVGRKNGGSLTRNRLPFAYTRAVLHNDHRRQRRWRWRRWCCSGSSLYHNPWHGRRDPSNYFRHRAQRNRRKNLVYWLFVNRIVCQQSWVDSLYRARIYTRLPSVIYLPVYLQRSFNSTQFPFLLPFCRDVLPMSPRRREENSYRAPFNYIIGDS